MQPQKSRLDEVMDRIFRDMGITEPVTTEYIEKRRKERGPLPHCEADIARAREMGLRLLSADEVEEALASFEEMVNEAKGTNES